MMMSSIFLNYSESYAAWKDLRKTLLENISDKEKLQLVVDFWSMAPIEPRVIDWDSPKSWPTPWELLSQKQFDESAVSIGMEYTLAVSNSDFQLELILAKDETLSIEHIMLLVDGKWLLNYEHKKIIEWSAVKNKLKIVGRYKYHCEDKMHDFTQ
jgi:hypothetical protein